MLTSHFAPLSWLRSAGNGQPFAMPQRAGRTPSSAACPCPASVDCSGIFSEHASFTGTFVAMVAYDLTGQGWMADFTEFTCSPG